MISLNSISRLALAAGFTAVLAVNAAFAQPAQKPFEPSVGQDGKDVIWVPTPQALVDSGFFLRAGSLAELAAQMGVDPGALERTVTRFNGFAASGVAPSLPPIRSNPSAFPLANSWISLLMRTLHQSCPHIAQKSVSTSRSSS